MFFYKLLWCLIFIISVINGQSYAPSFLEHWLLQYRNIRNGLFNNMGRNSENKWNMRKARSMGKLQPPIPLSRSFPCNVTGFRSKTPPSNVNQIRPGDIDIIAALGDSITAGTGIVATNQLQLLVENRGITFSIGGQGTWREFLTLPNILKEFNPNLFGYSTRDSLSEHYESQFNPAEAGAISSEIPYMTEILIRRIKSDPRVDLNQHWKLITILFGPNDFCLDNCFKKNLTLVLEEHRNDMIQTLRLLRDHLPRTIVNIIPVPDVTQFKKITNLPLECEILRHLECMCFWASNFQNRSDELMQTLKQWQQIDKDVILMDEFQQNEFAVVLQPVLQDIAFSKMPDGQVDLSYFSVDCYHLSQKLTAQVALSLWNIMLEKVGEKSEKLYPLYEFTCPTEEHPYIYTLQNSNL